MFGKAEFKAVLSDQILKSSKTCYTAKRWNAVSRAEKASNKPRPREELSAIIFSAKALTNAYFLELELIHQTQDLQQGRPYGPTGPDLYIYPLRPLQSWVNQDDCFPKIL